MDCTAEEQLVRMRLAWLDGIDYVAGVDPFADPDISAAGTLACRVYQSEDGSPTVDHLREALAVNR